MNPVHQLSDTSQRCLKVEAHTLVQDALYAIGLFSDDMITIVLGPKAMSLSSAYNGHSDNRGDCVFHDRRVLFGLSLTKGIEFLWIQSCHM